jgi:hypothetical protein
MVAAMWPVCVQRGLQSARQCTTSRSGQSAFFAFAQAGNHHQYEWAIRALRDAAPEGFGLDLLLASYENETLDEVQRMDLASGDGVGALEVCLPEHHSAVCVSDQEHSA